MQQFSLVVSLLHVGGKYFAMENLRSYLNDFDRPITSYGALDLPTYFIDVTPFVPLLADGKPHNFTIDVVSAESDHTTLQNWFVSGNLQVFTDPSGLPTTDKILQINSPPFAQTQTDGTAARNGDLTFSVKATRNIQIQSQITSGSGKTTNVVWTQKLQYINSQQWRTIS
jgi:hypothetical protein